MATDTRLTAGGVVVLPLSKIEMSVVYALKSAVRPGYLALPQSSTPHKSCKSRSDAQHNREGGITTGHQMLSIEPRSEKACGGTMANQIMVNPGPKEDMP